MQDGTEVQQYWRKFVTKIDKMVEEALRNNLRKSLQVPSLYIFLLQIATYVSLCHIFVFSAYCVE